MSQYAEAVSVQIRRGSRGDKKRHPAPACNLNMGVGAILCDPRLRPDTMQKVDNAKSWYKAHRDFTHKRISTGAHGTIFAKDSKEESWAVKEIKAGSMYSGDHLREKAFYGMIRRVAANYSKEFSLLPENVKLFAAPPNMEKTTVPDEAPNVIIMPHYREGLSDVVFHESNLQLLLHSLLSAVSFLHLTLGVAHCDLSYVNTRWCPGSGIVLIDFGKARPLWAGERVTARAYPTMHESLAPPEQYRPPNCTEDGYNVQDSDIWGIGTILCYAYERKAMTTAERRNYLTASTGGKGLACRLRPYPEGQDFVKTYLRTHHTFSSWLRSGVPGEYWDIMEECFCPYPRPSIGELCDIAAIPSREASSKFFPKFAGPVISGSIREAASNLSKAPTQSPSRPFGVDSSACAAGNGHVRVFENEHKAEVRRAEIPKRCTRAIPVVVEGLSREMLYACALAIAQTQRAIDMQNYEDGDEALWLLVYIELLDVPNMKDTYSEMSRGRNGVRGRMQTFLGDNWRLFMKAVNGGGKYSNERCIERFEELINYSAHQFWAPPPFALYGAEMEKCVQALADTGHMEEGVSHDRGDWKGAFDILCSLFDNHGET